MYRGNSIWIWAREQIGARNGIIYRRIQKSYDIDKYTKIYGGGRYRNDANTKGSWIILDYGNCKFEYGEFESGGE
jgi:hypothetical protein